jgi:SAM-dependent methyltransferase
MKKSSKSVIPTHDISVALPMNTKYVTDNPIGRFLIKQFLTTMVSLLQPIQPLPQLILDVGCGEGLIPRQLRAIWPTSKIIGLDIDIALLKVAQELVSDVSYIVGSGYNLPFSSTDSDLVICTEVLEHVDDPHLMLVELARVGQGYFLLSVPNEPWWRLANMARGSYWSGLGNTPGHINHWHSNQFVRLLSNYMTVLEVKRPFPWTMVLCCK